MNIALIVIGTFLVSFIFGLVWTARIDKKHESLNRVSIYFALGISLIVWGILL